MTKNEDETKAKEELQNELNVLESIRINAKAKKQTTKIMNEITELNIQKNKIQTNPKFQVTKFGSMLLVDFEHFYYL